MELAVVVGQVVSTVKCPGFEGDRLLLVDFIDPSGKPQGNLHVAADSIGAGTGEWVLVVGKFCPKTVGDNVPVDMSVVGIVDEVVVGQQVVYHK
jgi:ethanolamine utilization protein EutN